MTSKINALYETILDNGIFEFESHTLKNSSKTEYYFNSKKIYSNVTIVNDITDIIVNKIERLDIEYKHIVSVPYGAIPISSIVSNKVEKPLLFVRKESKINPIEKVICGTYEFGDEVILIEDVLTAGSGILETVAHLENRGISISAIILIFDRETGALDDLKETLNIPIVSVFKISSFINYYSVKKLLNEFDLGKLISSMATDRKHYINLKETLELNKKENDDYLVSVKNYDYIFKNKLSLLLTGLVIKKKTNLCLALDVTKWEDGKVILDMSGPYICMVKLQCDLLTDIDCIDTFIKELKDLARKHKFLIMADSKIGDVDKITYKKLTEGFYKMHEWANFVTIHGLSAMGCYDYMCDANIKLGKKEDKKEENKIKEINDAINEKDSEESEESEENEERKDISDYFNNLCLVTDMNQTDNLFTSNYKEGCIELLNNNKHFSECVISQNGTKIKDRIKLTSGIHLLENEIIETRKYRNIKTAIMEEKNHIIIVGSAIIDFYYKLIDEQTGKGTTNKNKNAKTHEILNSDLKEKYVNFIINYRNIGWYYFEKEYVELINKFNESNYKILSMFNSVFALSDLEQNLIKRDTKYNNDAKQIVLRENELFIKNNNLNNQVNDLQIQRKDFLYCQVVCYVLFTMITLYVNYTDIIHYIVS